MPSPPGSTSDPAEAAALRATARAQQLAIEAVPVPRLELCVEREHGQPTDRARILDGELFRLGSHPGNEIVLDDSSVSPFHCCLTRTAEGLRVTDSGSRGGTRVNGVSVRDADLPLPECRLTLGDAVVRVRDLGAARVEGVPPGIGLGALVGASVPMRLLFEAIKRVARSDVDVLIEGESGTGKELCAGEIVRLGARAEGPFVVLDCASVSPQLVESELFGHARGSFTGAARDRAGAFEEADGGTLFLDEIGELPLDMQPKLLRALASREIRRVGENRARRIDVRVLAATHRRLDREVNAGRFRGDLYYRLCALTVRVPPLRERIGDLPLLVRSFLEGRGALDKAYLFPPAVLDEMDAREWPGNVRELRNDVERRLVLEGYDDAPPSRSAEPPAPGPPAVIIDRPFKEAKDELIAAFERAYLTELNRRAGGNVTHASQHAGIDRMHVHRLYQRYGIRAGRSLGS
jgi:transcriptional regulator with AAA-type ATPase domain